jgi:alcohol dehydrogenase
MKPVSIWAVTGFGCTVYLIRIGRFIIPIKICNAILLPHVERFNMSARMNRFVEIALAMGEPIDGLPVSSGAEKALEAIKTLSADIGIPAGLGQLGVKEEDLISMAQNAQKDPSGLTNPRRSSLDDMVRIYQNAL